jgi:predicted DsbA family dithiol-disulfide isomerase
LLHPEVEGRAVPRTRLSVPPDAAGAERLRVEVGREAAETGIPFELPAFVPDTRPALEALELARDVDPALAERVRGALFRAYFGEATDIGDPDALVGVCVASGLDREALVRTLEDGRYRGITAEVEVEAESLDIEALPTLLFGRFKVVGRAPLPVMLDALARATGETE